MNKVIIGDCRTVLKTFNSDSVQCCVTSPPYFSLRDYGVAGQMGLEETPESYVAELVKVFQEVKRVLKTDGTLWLNLGDSYYNYRPGNYSDDRAHSFGTERTDDKKRGMPDNPSQSKRVRQILGLKEKDLIGIPWRVAFALQADGWYLRQDIIWAKANPMPESVQDRCTKSHEYIFLLSKSPKYYFDNEAIKEPCTSIEIDKRPFAIERNRLFDYDSKQNKIKKHGKQAFSYNSNKPDKAWEPKELRNKRSVWNITSEPYSGAHFAVFPSELVKLCLLAGTKSNDLVIDPFSGSGTTGQVCAELCRDYIGIELNPTYAELREHERSVIALPL